MAIKKLLLALANTSARRSLANPNTCYFSSSASRARISSIPDCPTRSAVLFFAPSKPLGCISLARALSTHTVKAWMYLLGRSFLQHGLSPVPVHLYQRHRGYRSHLSAVPISCTALADLLCCVEEALAGTDLLGVDPDLLFFGAAWTVVGANDSQSDG